MDGPTLGRAYLDGEVICRQGEMGDRMLILLDGAASVTVIHTLSRKLAQAKAR